LKITPLARDPKRPKSQLIFHAHRRVKERTTLTGEAIRALLDARRCVPLGIQKADERRVCLIYSEPDARCFVVVQSYRDWKIITVLPLRMWANGTVAEDSEAAKLARDLALGVIPADMDAAPVDRRVRVFVEEQADPASVAAIERHRREAAERRAHELARHNSDRERAAFLKTQHTVPDRTTYRNRQPALSKAEHERYLAILRLYSGEQRWLSAPRFGVQIEAPTQDGAILGALPKRLLCEPLMCVTDTADFLHIVRELAIEHAVSLDDITGIELVVGERHYPLTARARSQVLGGCRRLR